MTREIRSRRSQHTTGGGFSQIVWVFSAFVFGYVTAGFYDMASLTRLIDRMQNKTVAIKSAAPKPQAAIPPKPQFEFYTLLTKDNQGNIKRMVPAAHDPLQAPRDSTPALPIEHAAQLTSSKTLNTASSLRQPPPVVVSKPIAPIVSQARVSQPIVIQPKPAVSAIKTTFLIQIAAFNRREDAEHMKATLLLKGYDASVMAYDARPGAHWFRVVIGPYNKIAVDKMQTSLLQRHHIRGIIRQMPA